MLTISMYAHGTIVNCIYAPTGHTNTQIPKTVYQQLCNVLNELKQYKEIILAEDFNTDICYMLFKNLLLNYQ